ncbi:MAG: ATP-binding cassette domain-containing protein [Miltoncostaeaceae bacterium]
MDGVEIALSPGESLVVLGPNGAGKTTLLRMLATLLRPDEGSLSLMGHECPEHSDRARGAIGYLGHDPLVYLDLTAWQNLELFTDLYALDDAENRIADGLDAVGLLPRAYDPARTFSRGMVQRLGLARMLLHDPDLLLLDEPYAGLDARGRALLDEVLAGERAGRSTVMVTHDVERGVAGADRALVLRAGRAVLVEELGDADPVEFRARYEEMVR